MGLCDLGGLEEKGGLFLVGRIVMLDRSYLPSPSIHTNTPTPQAAPAKKEKAAAAPKTVVAKK